MSYQDYVKRVNLTGIGVTNKLINRTRLLHNRDFETSPSFYQVKIDGVLTDTVINKTKNYEDKKIHFKYGYDVVVGSVVSFKEDHFLILEKDKDDIYAFATMRQCNEVFKVEVDRDSIFVGNKTSGEPVYRDEIIYEAEPCVVSSKYYSASQNAQLPLPEGKLSILMKYQTAPNLKVNSKFEMYDKTYAIADLGYIDVINGVGVMEISAERVVDEK